MSRIKRGVVTRKRHRKILKMAKGYWGQRKNILLRARETIMRALAFAYVGRKTRKRDFRSLFIARVKAAAEMRGTKYSKLIHGLKVNHIDLNRKILSQIAIFDSVTFDNIVNMAMIK